MQSKPRTDSTKVRVWGAIFENDLPDKEQSFLRAASSGNLDLTKHYVEDEHININCQDYLGRGALELAVVGEHFGVVEYLYPRCNMMMLEDALLSAVGQDNVKMCEVILNHPIYKTNRFLLVSMERFYQEEDMCRPPRYAPETTPLLLACHRNNYHIIQLLLVRGANIEDPHDYFCSCSLCTGQRSYDVVRYSRARLSTYKAMASPAYISLSSEDPFSTAFDLSHTLNQLSMIEKEYKTDYQELSTQCMNYSVDLLELCRGTAEVMSVLNGDDGQAGPSHRESSTFNTLTADEPSTPTEIDVETSKQAPKRNRVPPSLTRVKQALAYNQKRFLSHPTCQRELVMLWYSGVPWIRHQHLVVKFLCVPMTAIFLPFLSLAYILAPYSKLAAIIRSPFIKFLMHTCSYMLFLLLVVLVTVRSNSTIKEEVCKNDGFSQDIIFLLLLFIWVLGMFWNEVRQLWRGGLRGYITDKWNFMDSALIALYLAALVLELVLFVEFRRNKANNSLNCSTAITQPCSEIKCLASLSMQWKQCNATDDHCHRDQTLMNEHMNTYLPEDIAQQVADILLSLAAIFSFVRIAHLLPANEQLGPLLVSFGCMLGDVIQFFAIFVLVFISFVCGMTNLYQTHRCENNYFTSFSESSANLFWATFGMGSSTAYAIDKKLLAYREELVVTHKTHITATETIGLLLYSLYIVSALIVLINMLIAMMSNSFQNIMNDRDVEWKFARARLWMDFFETGCTIPPPFNLIPSPKHLIDIIRYLVKARKKRLSQRRHSSEDEPSVSSPSVRPTATRHISTTFGCRPIDRRSSPIVVCPRRRRKTTFYNRVMTQLRKRYIYKAHMKELQLSQPQEDMVDIKHSLTEINKKIKHISAQCRNPRARYQNWPMASSIVNGEKHFTNGEIQEEEDKEEEEDGGQEPTRI